MSKSIKAALLSGLIYPGLGQFMLKNHKRGLVIIATVTISLYFIIAEAIEQANAVVKILEQSGSDLDVETIINTVTQVTATTESNASLFINVIIVFWIIGIVDAYLAGRALDKIPK